MIKADDFVVNGLRGDMCGSRKFYERGSNFFTFFFFFFFFFFLIDKGREGPNTTISGPSYLFGVSLAGRWWPNTECWLVSFVVLQGIRTNIAKNPMFFVILGGSGPPVPPLSGSAHGLSLLA